MVDIKLLEDVIGNIDEMTYGELKNIKLLSEDEVLKIAKRVNCDNYDNHDVYSLCVTLLNLLRDKTPDQGLIWGENYCSR